MPLEGPVLLLQYWLSFHVDMLVIEESQEKVVSVRAEDLPTQFPPQLRNHNHQHYYNPQ